MNKILWFGWLAWLVGCSSSGKGEQEGSGGDAGRDANSDAGQVADAGQDGDEGIEADAGQDGDAETRADSGQDGGADRLGLNDVSILFPLPEATGDGLYRASDVAAFGEVLPLTMQQAVGTIARVPCGGIACEMAEPVPLTRPRLRVVGARIDPCFPVLAWSNCRQQVRFVLQPISNSGYFDDAAFHVFYDLPKEDFDALVSELATLSRAVPKDLPLGVHPLLAAEGTTGTFANALRKALFARVGGTRISRVTAMELAQFSNAWSFRGFDFDQTGSARPIGILGTTEHTQTLRGFGVTFPKPAIPAFAEDAPFSLFWDASKAMAATAAEQSAAYDAALVIENPEKKSVEQVSCAACHNALPARAWAERNLGLSSKDNPNAFSSPFDLSLTTNPEKRESTSMFHAFGYRDHDLGISQRTVNETAAVAAFLNARRGF